MTVEQLLFELFMWGMHLQIAFAIKKNQSTTDLITELKKYPLDMPIKDLPKSFPFDRLPGF